MINIAIDIETTGLTAGKHEIIEIGIVPYDENTFLPLPNITFSTYVRPVHWENIDLAAIEVNKINLAELKNAPTPVQVRAMLLQWKSELFGDDLFAPLGHNYASFDKQFLQLFFKDQYESIFDYHIRDSAVIANFLKDKKTLPVTKCSLSSLATFFKVDQLPLHSALSDAFTALAVYRNLLLY
jgi:DNA polymerase III epsilon subunit-like protein